MTKHNKWKVLKVQDHIKSARHPQVAAQPTHIREINYSYEETFTLHHNIHHISLYSCPENWYVLMTELLPSSKTHFKNKSLFWKCFLMVVLFRLKERSSDRCFILWWDHSEASRTLHIWHWVELHLSWWLCSLNWFFSFFFWCTIINMKVAGGSNAQERKERLAGGGGGGGHSFSALALSM